MEYIYFLGYSLKKSHSLRVQRKLPARVISVGNLTVGGTGKTPAVIAIAAEARKRGYQPCVLTRGYGGKAQGPCFVSRGEGPLIGAGEAGDEAALMAERLKGVPVVKGKDRYEAGIFALRHLEPESPNLKSRMLFILDDGFQHWRLFRDTDILLVDSTNPFGSRKLLPVGRLREPLSEMERADIIVITKWSQEDSAGSRPSGRPPVERLIDEIRDHNPDAPLYMAEHVPVGLKTLSGLDLPTNLLSGRRVLGFCGLGNPASFKKTLLDIRAELVNDVLSFRDHIVYTARHIREIYDEAQGRNVDWIVTTEKDIMKLKTLSVPHDMAAILVSLRIDFSIDVTFYENAFREA